MAFTYTWKINGLKKQDNPSIQLNDIIVQSYWECIGTDDNGNTGSFNGATPFEPDQVDPSNFTSYENLTEDQIIGWIQDIINTNPAYKTHIDDRIQMQIDSKSRLAIEVDETYLPWSKTPTAS